MQALEQRGIPAPTVQALIATGASTELPIDVWIGDDDGYVHRIGIAYDATVNGEQVSAQMTMTMSDWGTDVSIDVPPDDQVFDVDRARRQARQVLAARFIAREGQVPRRRVTCLQDWRRARETYRRSRSAQPADEALAVPLLARFAVALAINALALWIANGLFGGVHIEGWAAYVFGALVLGFANAILKPILAILHPAADPRHARLLPAR